MTVYGNSMSDIDISYNLHLLLACSWDSLQSLQFQTAGYNQDGRTNQANTCVVWLQDYHEKVPMVQVLLAMLDRM